MAVALTGVLASCGTSSDAEPRPKAPASEIRFSSLAPDVYRPCGLSAAGGAAWVLSCSGKVVRIRPGGDRIAREIEGEVVGLDALSGDASSSLFVLVARGSGAERRGAVVPIDASAGETKAAIDLGASIPMHGAHAAGTTWVAGIDGGLFTIDGDSPRRVASGSPLLWIATDGRKVWTVAETGDVVERSNDGTPLRTFAGVLPDAIAAAAGEGSVWLAAETGLVRLDTATGSATRVDVTGTVNHIESCGGSVWLSQPDFGLRALDATGKILRSVRTSEAPSYLACDGSRLWVLTESGSLGSIDTTN